MDISRLDIDVGDNADLLVTDQTGDRTGFDSSSGTVVKEIPSSSYLQDFLTDNLTGMRATGTTHSVQIVRPSQQTYDILVTGLKLGTYTLSIASFSQDRSAQPRSSIPGIAAPGSSSSFNVSFSPTPGSSSKVVRVASFQTTLVDISNCLQLGLIDNKGIAQTLLDKIKAASDAAAMGQTQASKNQLIDFKTQVSQMSIHINGVAQQVLLEDADSLISQNL